MTRTDRHRRPHEALLQAEIIDTDAAVEVRTASEEPSGTGRGVVGDFPNSEELRRRADRYQLADNVVVVTPR